MLQQNRKLFRKTVIIPQIYRQEEITSYVLSLVKDNGSCDMEKSTQILFSSLFVAEPPFK